MEDLSKEEREVLFHTLGLDYGKVAFRNNFLAGDGHHDMPALESLVAKGLMFKGPPRSFGVYFHATSEAKEMAVSLRFSLEPKLTRSQARYRRYLDCDSSMTFIEWCRPPHGAKAYGL